MAKMRLYTFLVAEDEDENFFVYSGSGFVLGDHSVEYPDPEDACHTFHSVVQVLEETENNDE